MQTANYPITDAGTIDMGDEFPSAFMTPARYSITDEDIVKYLTQGPSRPRPTVTAWEGANMDAYYLDDSVKWVWLHCQTGAVWTP